MPRVNPTLAAAPQPSVPPVSNETSSSTIGTIAISIIGLLASFVFLPFEAALPIGAAIVLAALCFNGCLNPANIRNTFMTARPPAVGPRLLQPRVDDYKAGEGPSIPIAVPAQPFTGYRGNPIPRHMATARLGQNGRCLSYMEFSGRPIPSAKREEVHD